MTQPDSLLKVVSIGGGTGLACLLKGLKHSVLEPPMVEALSGLPWISHLTAVVTVTDDGGSSGRLRKEHRMPPPGDIRNCLVALSADENLMSLLFQYRFRGRGDLRDHSFGNLFLTALTGVTGDFLKAIRLTSEVLAIRGRIYPSTLQDVKLKATVGRGRRIHGESAISRSKTRIRKIAMSPTDCRPVPGVLKSIGEADIITVGPGSLYTSVMPNLLVRGISRAIRRSGAVRIYIGNLMTQQGETSGYTASDHLRAIEEHAGPDLFDGVILNRSPLPPSVLARYQKEKSLPVLNDLDAPPGSPLRIYEDDLLAEGKVIRHDPDLLAAAIHEAYKIWRKPTDPASRSNQP